MQVYWDHLCQDNSSGGLGSSPCFLYIARNPVFLPLFLVLSGTTVDVGCTSNREAMCPWVDLLNPVHHIKILPLMSQALGWLLSKGDMVEREVFTKKN